MIANRLRLLSVDWFWRGCRHVSQLIWRNDGCAWHVSHYGCSIDRSEQRRCFVGFVELPSVTSQLSMLALHKVGAMLDMRASNDCQFSQISSLDVHNITAIQLLQRRCNLVWYIFCRCCRHRRSRCVSTMFGCSNVCFARSFDRSNLLINICDGDIADLRLVCSYTRVGRGRDHDHHRLLS